LGCCIGLFSAGSVDSFPARVFGNWDVVLVYFLQVLYFGDSLCSDSFPAKVYGNWDVVLVLEEMEAEGYHPDLKDVLEPKRKVPKHEV
jgi:hypothetical protein